jgi:spore germination protein
MYNVDYRKIASDNEIPLEQTLVIGQTLVVILNNDDKKFREIEVNGYAFTNINKDILQQVLPSLTYLSIFSYSVEYNGGLKNINDSDLILMAKTYGTIPIMVITNIGDEGRFDSNLASTILNNDDIQDKLIDNILDVMYNKGYSGLNIDFEYVYPDDKEAFINFISKVKLKLEQFNYTLSVAVAPKTSDEQKGLLYEAHDYKRIGQLADRVVIMTYEWGYSGGPARAVAPVNLIERVLDYAVENINPKKILMGIPNYGYDWITPYQQGTLAKSVGNYEAVDLARNYQQSIDYDYKSEAPYFNYWDIGMQKHEVWFEDARSIEAKLQLIIKYNLGGASYWTINRFFPQNYLVLNSLFDIKKYDLA